MPIPFIPFHDRGLQQSFSKRTSNKFPAQKNLPTSINLHLESSAHNNFLAWESEPWTSMAQMYLSLGSSFTTKCVCLSKSSHFLICDPGYCGGSHYIREEVNGHESWHMRKHTLCLQEDSHTENGKQRNTVLSYIYISYSGCVLIMQVLSMLDNICQAVRSTKANAIQGQCCNHIEVWVSYLSFVKIAQRVLWCKMVQDLHKC